MGRDALSIGANTFQFFTRNPRGGKAKDLDQGDIDAFLALATEHGFGKLLAHAPYTLNPCSADAKTRNFALETMIDDLARMNGCRATSTTSTPAATSGRVRRLASR